MRPLKLKEKYSREEVHSIFSPQTNFTSQAGTWGLQGIVKIPDRDHDFVFFVSYGQSQGDHDFDEGITEDGVLSWQSQPRQGFDNKTIQILINHNDLLENIYLFLRQDLRGDYDYLGRLAYLSHDNSREKPVHFQWQLMDWDEISGSITSTPDTQESSEENVKVGDSTQSGELILSAEMPTRKRQGTDRHTFRGRKSPDYAERDSRNRKLGEAGEDLVLRYEKQRLLEAGRRDLAESIVHTSLVEGDGAGYDIKSFNEDASVRYIEVKTTRGGINTDFYMSPNEIRFSEQYNESFFLYRLYEFGQTDSAKFYIIQGNVLDSCIAEPTAFKLSPR